MSASGPADPASGPAPRALAVVPARLASSRLERKMLLRESGRYLFEHTVRNVERAASVSRVVLATDAEEIRAAAERVGIDALLTSVKHPSGTDRVHEACTRLGAQPGTGPSTGDPAPWDVVVNVQGDEPELPPADLDLLVAAFSDPQVELATLATPIEDPALVSDPAVVKVVCDARGDALYFSRASIPARHPGRQDAAPRRLLRHVGVYAFRPAALERFCALPVGRLEAEEGLEQLRWLEAGLRIRILQVAEAPPGIDDSEQYAAFVARIRARTSHRPHPDPSEPFDLRSVQGQSA